jgi:3-oxoadipate enol-lactonase/4-carboxymuconolactone decarboxylase
MNASAQMAETLRVFRQTHSTRILQVGMDRWEYILGGKGERTIVVIGGGGSTAESMFSINEALETNCQVVSLGIPTSAATIEDVNRGIEGVLDALGIGQAIFLGHSLGGMVAQSFAVHRPERVAGMVLSGTGFYLGARAALIPAATRLMMLFPKAMLLRAVGSQMERLLKPSQAADFWLQFYQEEIRQPTSGPRLKHQGSLLVKYAVFFRDNPIHSGLPWANSLPVQIIAAEDDRGFTRREIAYLGSLYPRSQTLTLPAGTGHLSFLTRPREYVDAVEKFMASVVNRGSL